MMILNEKTAELIGMHIGDGTLYRTSPTLVWELRGGLDEKEYYYKIVKPLLESIFGLPFEPKFRSGGKNGCFGIQTSKKEVTSFFLEVGFSPGTKTYTVRVPEYIFGASTLIRLSFVRGLFDTDGCISFYRPNNKSLATYPRVELSSASEQLRNDLFSLLSNLGFRAFVWGNLKRGEYKICLAGKEQVERWFSLVKPHNAKHLNKFKFWKEQGHHMPRSHNLVLRRIAID